MLIKKSYKCNRYTYIPSGLWPLPNGGRALGRVNGVSDRFLLRSLSRSLSRLSLSRSLLSRSLSRLSRLSRDLDLRRRSRSRSRSLLSRSRSRSLSLSRSRRSLSRRSRSRERERERERCLLFLRKKNTSIKKVRSK